MPIRRSVLNSSNFSSVCRYARGQARSIGIIRRPAYGQSNSSLGCLRQAVYYFAVIQTRRKRPNIDTTFLNALSKHSGQAGRGQVNVLADRPARGKDVGYVKQAPKQFRASQQRRQQSLVETGRERQKGVYRAGQADRTAAAAVPIMGINPGHICEGPSGPTSDRDP